MAKFAADKTQIYLTATGAAAATPVAITGITSAMPAVVSPQPVGIQPGDVVIINDTGNAKLDGKSFVAGALVAATGFELDGVDLTNEPVIDAGEMVLHQLGGVNGMLPVCLATLVLTTADPPTIDMGDLCGPGSILGTAPPPTFSYTGWADPESEGFKNWIQAALESPKTDRILLLVFPGDNGYIVGPAAIGSFSTGASTGQGVGISGNGTFLEMPTISWAL